MRSIRPFPLRVSAAGVLSAALAALPGCTSCQAPAPPPEPPPVAFAMPEPAPLAVESGRPILSRAAAFVPADAQLVVVFRTWREAVESLALRGLLDNPVGRDLLEAWKIGGASLTDLPGLANLGMDVDQSLVFALLPDESIVAVVASETPAKLLGLFQSAAGGGEGQAVTVQGREARAFLLGDARFTVVLHPRHVQVVVSNPNAPAANVDNQLQAGFDSAPVWVRRAAALPTPQGAAVVLWTAGDPPEAPDEPPPEPLPAGGKPDLMALVERFEALYRVHEVVAALSFPGGDVRLDVISPVRDVEPVRARLRTGLSPEQLLRLLPAGPQFATTARFSGRDAEVFRQLFAAMPANLGGLSPEVLPTLFPAGAAPEMFRAPGQVRATAFARYAAASPGGAAAAGSTHSLVLLETGPLANPGEVLPRALKALATAYGKAEVPVTEEKCGPVACWRLAFDPPLVCAASPPLLLCGLGEGPLRQSATLLAAGLPPRTEGSDALSLGHADVPALTRSLSEMADKAGTVPGLGAALKLIGDDIGALTYTERLGPENVTITLSLQGRGHPILPSLVPRVMQAVGPLLPLLE